LRLRDRDGRLHRPSYLLTREPTRANAPQSNRRGLRGRTGHAQSRRNRERRRRIRRLGQL